MRIIMVTNRLEVGGIERNLVVLCGELAQRGHQVTVASAPGTLVSHVTAAGASHVSLRGGARHLLIDSRTLRRLWNDEKADAVHVFSAWSALLMWLSRWPVAGRRPRVVASMMGIVSRAGEPRWRVLGRAALTGVGSDVLVAPSPAMRALANRLPWLRRRIRAGSVVGVRPRHAISEADLSALRSELGIASRRLVVTIGRLDSTKAHHLFIDAAAILCANRSDATFLVVGEGSDRPSLETRIPEQHSGAIRLVGERHDVDSILALSDVCVRPGVVEGFVGITVLEAQVRAVPVVAFETLDVKEAIEDGRTGILVPPGDINALADAVAGLLDEPVRSRAIGEAGRASVAERFGLDGVIGRLETLYAERG